MTTTGGRRSAGGSPQVAPTSETAWRAWSTMCDLVLDNERRREVSDAIGLSFGRVKALRRIARHPMTMGELAIKLGIDAPYATLVVDELERQGLVERRPHPTDRRVKLVTATPRGAKEAQRAQDILNRLPVGMEALSGAELETLATILAKIRLPASGD
ncbi:MAG TPA: MarR family transcriptional regulator [Acidimicrobiales bacterium]